MHKERNQSSPRSSSLGARARPERPKVERFPQRPWDAAPHDAVGPDPERFLGYDARGMRRFVGSVAAGVCALITAVSACDDDQPGPLGDESAGSAGEDSRGGTGGSN